MQNNGFVNKLVGFLAVAALLAAITLNVVSLAIPYWLNFEVDRSSFSNLTGLEYYNRSRGAFLTCLWETNAAPLSAPAYSAQVKYSSCLELDLGGNINSSMASYLGSDAETILVLRRLHIGLHIASGFVLCVALLACVICLARAADYTGLVAPVGLSLLAAGLQFGAHVAFNNTLMRELLPPIKGTTAAATAAISIYNAWPSNLQLATRVTPGASYYIALGAFSTCLASAGTNLIGVALAKNQPKPASSGFDSPYAPTGSASKAGNDQQPMHQMQPYSVTGGPGTRYDNFSNVSAGVQSTNSGRLPRIPVNQSFGGY